MSTKTISSEALTVLSSLRDNVEYETRPGFGAVYLDNARPKEMSAHVFAGLLSALESAGLYEKENGLDCAGIWGHVDTDTVVAK